MNFVDDFLFYLRGKLFQFTLKVDIWLDKYYRFKTDDNTDERE